jgi:glutamate N-acetyltransferase/amino-acid N-acetyltransferase
MIHPEMATTLSFITTDANITKRALKKALKASINNTLNLISVEGDMSPNDSAFILANGQAQNKTIDIKSKSFIQFSKALTLILFRLSELLVKDAEGASKLIRVKVKKAISYKQARRIAFDVANSNLVKTACYGEDPNWGRVVSCVGSSGIKLEPKKIEVSFDDMTVFKNLEPQDYDKSKLRRTFKKKHIDICINLNQGKEELTVLTSDLTPDYVRLNAHYGNYKKWKK